LIPPNLHFNHPNSKVSWDKMCLEIPTRVEKLVNGKTHYASINSFGYGGTNGHVLLKAHTPSKSLDQYPLEQKAFLVPVSARSTRALKDTAKGYFNLLAESKNILLSDFVHTLSKRRTHHNCRMSCVASSKKELMNNLMTFYEGGLAPTIFESSLRKEDVQKIVFVFAGLGAQSWDMGRELIKKAPVFRNEVEKCNESFKKLSGWCLTEELSKDKSLSRMHKTEVAQPANFIIQVALAKIWESWGIKPDAVIGHSAGEVAACYISGALSLEESMLLIYHRSRLQQKCASSSSGMLAVGLSEEESESLIFAYSDTCIAAVNSASSVTLSGNISDLQDIHRKLDQKKVFNRFLKVDVAYHSSNMDPIEEEFRKCILEIKPQNSKTPFYSTVTGRILKGERLTAEYWWHNMRFPVLFSNGIKSALNDIDCHFLEI